MENSEVVQLYLDDIIPNRFQPREVFNDQALKELAISIREHGVIQPILVRKFGEKYEIIAGERRYKASTMAGLTKIPAIVKNLDDKESSKVALIENLQRRDLTPIEEARTYQKILDLDEMTQEELAKTMGKSQSAVSNKLRLLSLPDEIQEALLKEEISERHARSLLNVEDKNIQINLLKEIVNSKMSVRELDSKIKKLTNDDNDTTTEGGIVAAKEIEEIKEVDVSSPVNSFFGNVANEPEKLFDSETKEESTNLNSSSLFSEEPKVENTNFNSNSLFSEEPKVESTNFNSSSLFSEEPKVESTNLNSNSLFSEEPKVESIFNNGNDMNSLFNDPTTVNINKIREESSDINPFVQEKESPDIKSLLKPNGIDNDTPLTFVKSFDEDLENQKTSNEINGSGLLSEMPAITPVENKSSAFSSLFESPKNEKNDSLFINNQNAINSDNVLSANNVQIAVNDVKDVIKSYQEKGYTITVEELDLDREVHLIIKFNKN